MLRKLKIGPRLLVLITVQGLILLVLGGISMVVLRYALDTTRSLNTTVAQSAKLISLSDTVRSDLVGTVHAANDGVITWEAARDNLAFFQRDFEAGWKDFFGSLSAEDAEFANDVLSPHVDGVREAYRLVEPIMTAQSRPLLSLFASNDLNFLVGPFLNALVASTSLQQLEAEEAVGLAAERGRQFTIGALSVFAAGVLLAMALGVAIYRSVVRPLRDVSSTVEQIAQGDLTARTGVTGRDELGALGVAFDNMLDERVSSMSQAERENRQLNDSVIALLQAVSKLSRRDLTVRVPVTEDVTGPVADSLNLLTRETAKVLQGVQEISQHVARASTQVKTQSDHVIALARKEQVEVDKTAAQLSEASAQMTQIARLAHASAQAADRAIATTRTAMATVTDTVGGINGIRDTIRETEKRIKRLGERSQEISGVVDLINSIAERTHILALNASMHAASAGEAGRGFAVVADEVQRLAENARDATSQISTLVNNIQVETADTVTTMNEAIGQVVEGSRLAEQAGEQMEKTRDNTSALVEMVQKIAHGSKIQAQTSLVLKKRAEGIRRTTQGTSQQLKQQSTHTVELVGHARRLLEAVDVFELPGRKIDETELTTPGEVPKHLANKPAIAASA